MNSSYIRSIALRASAPLITLTSIAILGAGLLIPASAFAAGTIYVDSSFAGSPNGTQAAPYPTIQQAITAAGTGDTIDVAAGTYSGDLIIPVSNLTIQGTGSVILNLGSGYGINLDNDEPNVTGFTLNGFTVNALNAAQPTGTSYAFKAYHANGLTLNNDTFNGGAGNTGGGVDINSTSNVTFNNVTSTGFHKNGFADTSAYTAADDGLGNTITFNNITSTDNNWTGISFYTTGNSGGSASITGVTFTGTNTISGNTQPGIFIEGDTDTNLAAAHTPANTVTTDGTTLNLQDVAFSSNTAFDIYNYQTAPLNAIGATFAGLTGDQMNSTQRTAEDAKIEDKLDNANYGLVSYFTPPPSAPEAITDPATNVTTSDATLNGTNGNNDAQGHSFWVSTNTIDTSSPTIPAGVYSTPDMGAITANATFAPIQLSSLTSDGVPGNMPAVTPGTTYYYVAWSEINGTWYPGEQQQFTTLKPTYTVTIDKFLDNSAATAESAGSNAFPMVSSWNAENIGSGSGSYTLAPTGFNSANPYEAVTSPMTSGASYTTNEDTTQSLVGASCSDGKPYALAGYSVGATEADAQAAGPSATVPDFTNLTSNENVIVWNKTCPPPDTTPPVVTVTPVAGSNLSGTVTFDITLSDNEPLDPTKNTNVWVYLYNSAPPQASKGAGVNLSSGHGTFTVDTTQLANGDAWLDVGQVFDAAGNANGPVDNYFKDYTINNTVAPTGPNAPEVITEPATNQTSSDATVNGMNGDNDASGHSIWVSLAPFVTTSPNIPAGVFSTPDMGAISANGDFSATLSSLTGPSGDAVTTGGATGTEMPAVTPNTTYYYTAWSLIDGTWYPGAQLTAVTSASDEGGGTGDTLQAPIPTFPLSTTGVLTTAELPAVTWDAVTPDAAGGIVYNYEVSLDGLINPNGSFTNPINIGTLGTGLTTTQINTPGTPDGTYFWHVEAEDADMVTSPWSTTEQFTIDNGPQIPPPTAGPNSSIDVPENSSATPISLTSDVDGTVTYAIVTPPGHGTLGTITVAASTGTVSYTPTANYTGADFFTYTATSGGQTSAPATVFITVTPVTPPAPTGVIGGEVYNDVNRNGVLNNGEAGLAGWTINLYDNAGWSGPTNIPPFKTTVSDANGDYSFTSLADGTYSIEEIKNPASGFTQFTSDISPVVITGGADITNQNFGDVKKSDQDQDNDGNGKGNGGNGNNGNGGGNGGNGNNGTSGQFGPGNGNGNGGGNGGNGGNGNGNGGNGRQGQVLGASTFNFTKTLSLGSKGDDVTQLQLILIADGYLKIKTPTGVFGASTKAAVIKYQIANGITPANGIVGPKTRAALNV